jgi:hypothetical protein
MKMLIGSVILMTSTVFAGPRFLVGEIESKIVGQHQISIKIRQMELPIEAVPKTFLSIDQDNGQILSMDCVTEARFEGIAEADVKVLSSTKPIFNETVSFGAAISDSYSAQDPSESCNTVSLNEITKGSIFLSKNYLEIPVKTETETLILGISPFPFFGLQPVTVSGDENRMSLDGVDIFTALQTNRSPVYFQVMRKQPGSVSFLEQGQILLELR